MIRGFYGSFDIAAYRAGANHMGNNYFDQFDVLSQPPTLPALPDWMTGSASSFGPNGLPDWMTNTSPTPASPSGGNFFDQFNAPAPPAPSASAPGSPPRAADYPTPVPIPTPQPASGLNSYHGRGQARWNAARAQAAANPPIPSAVPTPTPFPPPKMPDDTYKSQVEGNFGVMKLLQKSNPYVEAWSRAYNLDPDLVRAIILHESRGFGVNGEWLEAAGSYVSSLIDKNRGSFGFAQLGPQPRRAADLTVPLARTMPGSIKGAAIWLAHSRDD